MPSMHAWSALIGSISVTMTREPEPRSAAAQPLPTSPKPQINARLPPIITSVARMMPSVREWRQPYTLSNFDFVTQSFTLMAGKSSSPFAAIFFRRATPVVVSSDTPRIDLPIFVHFSGSFWIDSRIRDSTHLNSGLFVEAGSGSDLSFAYCASYLVPSWIRSVASPPSSTSMSGPSLPGHVSICSVHHQYSSSVSPLREHRRGRGLGLGREDVAARPADLRTEGGKRLDENAGLDRHVERAGDTDALERLLRPELRTGRHQTRHLNLSERKLLAAELRHSHILHLRIRHCDGCGERDVNTVRS